jgi:hypothetical protein
MNTTIDPAEMAPEQRLAEVAAILGHGFLRLRKHSSYLSERPNSGEISPNLPPENTAKNSQN